MVNISDVCKIVPEEKKRLLLLDKACKNGLGFEDVLHHVTLKIRFLRFLCKGNGSCKFVFSDNLERAIRAEISDLCITSSALHSILRDNRD